MKQRTISARFARPADTTAYASGDLVANSTTAGSVIPLAMRAHRSRKGGMTRIRRVRLLKSGTGITNASFRVHFYSTQPSVTNGDNGVWLSTQSGYLGSVDVAVDRVFSNGAAGVGNLADNAEILATTTTARQNIFALIEARGTYTPGSAEAFTVEADVEELPDAN